MKNILVCDDDTAIVDSIEIYLQQEGYQVERVKLMDMFPRTVHVETVCLLSKGNPNK